MKRYYMFSVLCVVMMMVSSFWMIHSLVNIGPSDFSTLRNIASLVAYSVSVMLFSHSVMLINAGRDNRRALTRKINRDTVDS